MDKDIFNSDPKTFAGTIDRYIQHGSRPEGPSPSLAMLPFGDTRALTQQQIADIEAYVMKFNGVDRAMIYYPGISPGIFFLITIVVFVVAGLGLAGLWSRRADEEIRKEEIRKTRSESRRRNEITCIHPGPVHFSGSDGLPPMKSS